MEQLGVLHQQLLLRQQAKRRAILQLQTFYSINISDIERTLQPVCCAVDVADACTELIWPVQICSLLGARVGCLETAQITLALMTRGCEDQHC
jgi:hypothetical protein